ncbi:TRAF3-interacting JNK-activating modulator [Galemys pyrenaicus]|uniref:TRAF3-interacting JNK-activating modulator n=1 Tax=Galemys pyrenaicus TaxID=202257 RepID=A0A8J6DFG5_GALPY|nr:TRAF3-interacting JNK-activating modulator [Galemys pyrenaicus]
MTAPPPRDLHAARRCPRSPAAPADGPSLTVWQWHELAPLGEELGEALQPPVPGPMQMVPERGRNCGEGAAAAATAASCLAAVHRAGSTERAGPRPGGPAQRRGQRRPPQPRPPGRTLSEGAQPRTATHLALCGALENRPAQGLALTPRLFQDQEPVRQVPAAAAMGPDLRPAPRRARGPESYEAKCERRQEARESRRRRPNMTTCRPAEKAPRARQREQLQQARQQQLARRRNLEAGGRGAAPPGPAQATDRRGPLLISSRVPTPRQQVESGGPGLALGLPASFQMAKSDSEASAAPPCPRSGTCRDATGPPPSQTGGALPQDPALRKPPQHHRGTQTPGSTQVATKKDASQQTTAGVAVLDKEIVQLSEYLQEALQRELVLKQKMVVLQDLLTTLMQASDRSWKGQLDEDRLKGRLRALESQLHACTQGVLVGLHEPQKSSPGGMKRALMEMEEQKSSYEQKAKEALQKVLEEKLSAEQQLQSTQRSLALAEQRCEEWRCQHKALKEGWTRLGTQHQELQSQLRTLQASLQGADRRDHHVSQEPPRPETEHQEPQPPMERLQGDASAGSLASLALQDQLKRSEEEKRALQAQVEQLQGLLRDRGLRLQEQEGLLAKRDHAKSSCREADSEDTEEDGWECRDQLQKTTLQLEAKEQECRDLRSELDNLSDEYLSCQLKLQHCREELSRGRRPPTGMCPQGNGQYTPRILHTRYSTSKPMGADPAAEAGLSVQQWQVCACSGTLATADVVGSILHVCS